MIFYLISKNINLYPNKSHIYNYFLQNKIPIDYQNQLIFLDNEIPYHQSFLKENFFNFYENLNILDEYYKKIEDFIKNINLNNSAINQNNLKNIYIVDNTPPCSVNTISLIDFDDFFKYNTSEGYFLYWCFKLKIWDITFFNENNKVFIKFRYKGLYYKIGYCDINIYNGLYNRWKIFMNLDIITQDPQSGVIKFSYGIENFNCRFSFYPLMNGTKISIRILNNQYTDLKKLNLDNRIYNQLLSIIGEKTFIAICGPSSTGKTTLAYGINKQLAQWGFHVMSIEHPVEYIVTDFDQANDKINKSLLFENLMRHDLDTIFVGEILDETMAKYVIEAMATGHGVIGTFHVSNLNDLKYRWLNLWDKFYKGYCIFPKIYYKNNESKMILEIYKIGGDLISIDYDCQINNNI